MKKFFKKIGKPIEKLGKFVLDAAPMLGNAVLNNKTEFIGLALNALGVDSIDKVNYDKLDSETVLKLKAIEQQHEAELLRIELETTKAQLADIQSARSMNVDLDKSSSFFNQHAAFILSLSITVVFALACYGAYTYSQDIRPNEMLLMLIGSLSGNFTQVVNYWLGSSRGSLEKSNILSKFKKE